MILNGFSGAWDFNYNSQTSVKLMDICDLNFEEGTGRFVYTPKLPSVVRGVKIKSYYRLFAHERFDNKLNNLQYDDIDVDLSYLDLTNASNLSEMFCGSTAIRNVRFGKQIILGNTDNKESTVTLKSMFSRCKNLESVDMSDVEICDKEVILNSLFSVCSNLKCVKMPKYGRVKVRSAESMFYRSGIEEFSDSIKVVDDDVDLRGMFAGCNNLRHVKVPRAVRIMNHILDDCYSIKELDLGDIGGSHVGDWYQIRMAIDNNIKNGLVIYINSGQDVSHITGRFDEVIVKEEDVKKVINRLKLSGVEGKVIVCVRK